MSIRAYRDDNPRTLLPDFSIIASRDEQARAAQAELARLLDGDLPTRSLLTRYEPQRIWFLRPEESGGIHGIGHEARVMIWQELLSRLLLREGVELDQEALRWAAATHDTQRLTDGNDYPHGERAAAWLRSGVALSIPPSSFDTVLYLDIWHVPSDMQAPEMTSDLAVFKDADGLDRVRIYDLDPAYLRWHYSRQLLQYLAQPLFDLSEATLERMDYQVFASVITAACKLGLLKDE